MAVLGLHWVMTLPLATSSAAKRGVVPWRTSSCVMPSTYPNPIGSTGWVRSKACTWLFSSTHSTNA
ncbi:hypothetical protein BXO558_16865 [Xanthomonas oryzae pv. oryzae]|nr:hypothetical protein BXO558_16865 [Xanthomonas oryzae pv. oryzae]